MCRLIAWDIVYPGNTMLFYCSLIQDVGYDFDWIWAYTLIATATVNIHYCEHTHLIWFTGKASDKVGNTNGEPFHQT